MTSNLREMSYRLIIFALFATFWEDKKRWRYSGKLPKNGKTQKMRISKFDFFNYCTLFKAAVGKTTNNNNYNTGIYQTHRHVYESAFTCSGIDGTGTVVHMVMHLARVREILGSILTGRYFSRSWCHIPR